MTRYTTTGEKSRDIASAEARRFLLRHHDLYRRWPKSAATDLLEASGAVRLDPATVLGAGVDLFLAPRVHAYRSGDCVTDVQTGSSVAEYYHNRTTYRPLKFYGRHEPARDAYRAREGDRLRREHHGPWAALLRAVEERGPVTAEDLDDGARMANHWGGTSSVARMLLDAMAQTGDVMVVRRVGNVKVFDLPNRWIATSSATCPFRSVEDYADFAAEEWIRHRGLCTMASLVDELREVAASLTADTPRAFARTTIARLFATGRVERRALHHLGGVLEVFVHTEVASDIGRSTRSRHGYCVLSPFDPLVADRELLLAAFAFDYTWELYKPPAKRKYGGMVLPILSGGEFVGRAEFTRMRSGAIDITNVWDARPHTVDLTLLSEAIHSDQRF